MLASNPVGRYSVLDSALAAIGGWIQKRKMIRECRLRFEACTSDEIARLAHDVGLPETDLRRMATLGPDAARQVLDRMTELHLSAETIASSEPGTMRDLQRLCSNCVSKKRCRRDLAQNPTDPVWRQYCPNAGTLGLLKGETTAAVWPR